MRIGCIYVSPVTSVRDLGLYIDCDVSLQARHHHLSDRASLPYGRYAVFGGVSHGTACCRSSVCYSSARSTTADRRLPSVVACRLQSILNVAARLVFSVMRSERITPLLRELYWLRVPERITFRLCVLTHRCLNGLAPAYLAENIRLTADVESCRHLRSSTTTATLVVAPVQRSTLGDRAFSVAAPRAWNSLPPFLRTLSTSRFIQTPAEDISSRP